MQRDEPTVLRVPPHSVEAEQSVLGSLLLDNAAWDRIGDLLTEADFYRHEHRLVFAAIVSLVSACREADIVTVYAQLEKSGKGAEVGGYLYLNSLAQAVPGSGNVRRYAEIVRENALLRRLVTASDEIAALAFAQDATPVEQRLDAAQQKLQDIHVGSGRRMPESIQSSVVRLLDRIQDASDGKEVPSLRTGIPGIDRMIGGGFKPGKQVIVAARPSVGKSSLGEQFCIHAALHEGVGAAYFSQEMSKDELTDRAIANIGRIALDRVISGKLENDEWNRLTEAVEKLRQCRLFLDDQPALTLHDITAKARALKRQHDVRLIVIDYIQLCGGKGDESRHHQIEQLSRGLKTLARQLDICIVTLSQLNREVEKRATARPVLSDLKESGSIEEDADIVMLLSRGSATPEGFQIINCDIPKNRQGRVGTVTLGFNGAHQEWHETVAPVEFKTPPRRHYTEDV
jgi:replicative DNA helicase